MSDFWLSGFADEACASLDGQIRVLCSLGIKHIELRRINGSEAAKITPEEAQGIYGVLKTAGISVSAIGSPMGKISIEEPFTPHLDEFKRAIGIARELKTTCMRIFSFVMPQSDYRPYEKEVLSRLGQFVRAAQGSGITLLHENEKRIYGDLAGRCLQIAKEFEGEIYLTFDPSNFVQCGQNTIEAFDMLRPYVRYLHLKDSLNPAEHVLPGNLPDKRVNLHRPIGQGDGNFRYILQALHEDGYSGYASLEPHLKNGSDTPPEELFKIAACAARTLIAEVTGAKVR